MQSYAEPKSEWDSACDHMFDSEFFTCILHLGVALSLYGAQSKELPQGNKCMSLFCSRPQLLSTNKQIDVCV